MNDISLRMVEFTITDKDGNATHETRLVPVQVPEHKQRNRAERWALETQKNKNAAEKQEAS